MSDFLFSTRRQPAGRLSALLDRRLSALRPRCEELHGDWGSLAYAALRHDGAVLRERDERITAVLGEPLETGAGRALPPSEGDWDPPFDGPFAALSIDARSGAGRVLTDLMAFVPVFWSSSKSDGALIVGSHVDAVADAAGRDDAFDAVSGADFVAHGSIVYPFTLYAGVEQVAPAAEWRFAADAWTARRQRWTPREDNPYGSVEEAAAELRRGLADDVARAVAGHDRAGMLLSAGEDSRAVLGAVPRGVHVESFTFADWESREVGIARRIARAYGAEFTLGLRSFGHYLEGLEAVASFVGSQHQFIDVHAWGLHERLGLDRLPVVLGGFSSDVLLKGYYSPTKARHSQPQKRHPGEHDPLRPGRAPGVRRELLEAARERRERRRAELRPIRPESATEWMRIWPFGVRKPAAAYLGHRRLFRAHEPFMSNAIVHAAAAVPIGWKLDRRLFSTAMRPFLRPSRFVPHARNMFPYFGLYTSLVLGAGVGVGRFASDLVRGRLGKHQGPWPDWWKLARSDLFTDLLARHPLERARAARLFETESPHAAERLVRDQWTPKRQMMLLQLAYLTGERDHGERENA